MTFYINSIQDTSVPGNSKVLPILCMELINDGRHTYDKFYEMIQNADITFSMVDSQTGVYKVANQPAFIKLIDDSCCEEKYEICYQFTKREVSNPGTYKGTFLIKFGNDIKNDSYEYPNGTLSMPIREDLMIIVR